MFRRRCDGDGEGARSCCSSDANETDDIDVDDRGIDGGLDGASELLLPLRLSLLLMPPLLSNKQLLPRTESGVTGGPELQWRRLQREPYSCDSDRYILRECVSVLLWVENGKL